jgi:hypothetical protein
VLSRKYDTVLFLHTLASSTRTTPLVTPFLPSLAPSPPTPAVSPIDAIPPPQIKKGRSKAELLRENRARSGILHCSRRFGAYSYIKAHRPSLLKPANSLYRHNLTATLETAIRSSNAQTDPPDVLRRLDARMLEYSQGEIGWDVFTLEYKVDAPLDTVLDPDSMVKYLKLSNHLWKMKRIENTMINGWVRTAGSTKAFIRIPGGS